MSDNIEIVKKLFTDDGYAITDMHEYTQKNLKQWEKELITAFPSKAKILDIGCGMGREAFCLNELGFAVMGIDIAKQIAASKHADIAFMVSGGLELPFADASFDIVIIWAQTFGCFMAGKTKAIF